MTSVAESYNLGCEAGEKASQQGEPFSHPIAPDGTIAAAYIKGWKDGYRDAEQKIDEAAATDWANV